MVMVKLSAARRHRRSRIGYALGLLVFLGAATALALVVRHPALSATQQLAEPVPAPEITVAEGDAGAGVGTAPDESEPDEDEPAAGADAAIPPTGTAGVGAGAGSLAEPAGDPIEPGRSLFYTGLLGLAISLAGLGLVGTRRRQW
ncbi:hypothetical protein [Micromonospora sp. WMMD980]|uniref:hypothetical protein n=1 Tax=Micromonospora sp. WMMD980 TaxID=3016088 RepID=UPI0024177F89|nr:hypothetical protein [Micromonospora sp. WMMD980]MDG4803949.1 hypothetical protein [Micromonospora sp. WMMD980]